MASQAIERQAALSVRCVLTAAVAVVSVTGCARLGVNPPPPDVVENLDTAVFDSLDAGIRAGKYGYVDHLLVMADGQVVFDEQYDNDYVEISRGRTSPIGCGADACTGAMTNDDSYNYLHPSTHPFYKGRAVHSLQSVTKSVAATVVGVAIARGDISGLDVPLLSFFEDYDLDRVDSRLRRATLEDLLTMRSGIEWHEQDRPLDETNTTIQLERSADWIQFTLDQPTDAEPGTKWAYNSGGSHLMSGVIRKATGMYIDEYAEKYLFGPLGIADYHWKKTPNGYPDTEGGLYLEAASTARIGQLYLNGGEWDGRQILTPTFAAAAVSQQVREVNRQGWGYGYQWWRLDVERDGETVAVWAGLGFGEQYLLVVPQHNLVGVINSWNLFGGRRQSSLVALRNALLSAR